MEKQEQTDVVAHDRVFVLQIVVKTEALRCEVLADDGHVEIRTLTTTVLLRERVTEMARRVGAAFRLQEQRFPLLVRQTAAVPVGPRVFAPMVEEALVVVLRLERLDLLLDEIIQLFQVGDEVRGKIVVHGVSCLRLRRYTGSPRPASRSNRDRRQAHGSLEAGARGCCRIGPHKETSCIA